jgi:integrase/recombinase XerC
MIKTLTYVEVHTLLKRTHGRNALLFRFALSTGLRCHELVALQIEDLLTASGAPRTVLALKVFKGNNGALQQVYLSRRLRAHLATWLTTTERKRGPLFQSRHGNALSTRQARWIFRRAQERAGFERIFNFHALRHTACTRVYAATKDLRLTQRFARHASVLTTMVYTHPSDEDLLRAVNRYC